MAWKPNYVETEELKAFLRINDSVDDTQLGLAISGASKAIDLSCNRQFGKVAVAEQRFYTARWDRQRLRWVVDVDDLMDVTGLDAVVQDAAGNDVGTIDAYVLEPRNAAANARPWTQLVVRPASTGKPTGCEGELAITALWGWSAVPDAIKEATMLQASRFHARRVSPYGVAGSPDSGTELRLLARLDVDVAVMVGPYRRWWGGA